MRVSLENCNFRIEFSASHINIAHFKRLFHQQALTIFYKFTKILFLIADNPILFFRVVKICIWKYLQIKNWKVLTHIVYSSHFSNRTKSLSKRALVATSFWHPPNRNIIPDSHILPYQYRIRCFRIYIDYRAATTHICQYRKK